MSLSNCQAMLLKHYNTRRISISEKKGFISILQGIKFVVINNHRGKHFLTEYTRGWKTFSIKSQAVNILSFLGHIVSVVTTQLCCCTAMKAAMDSI